MSRFGDSAVTLLDANTFTGALLVQGPNQSSYISSMDSHGSTLEGVAQAAGSPFGSPSGDVRLINSTIKLTGVTAGTSVEKRTLAIVGLSTLAIDANIDHPTTLAFSRIMREGRAVLAIDPQQESLGDHERVFIREWKTNRDLMPPWCLYVSTKRWLGNWCDGKYQLDPGMTTGPDFIAYEVDTGMRRFNAYHTDLATATATDVVKIGSAKWSGATYAVRALRTTGSITGKGLIHIREGGLILGGDFTPDLDFGDTEGVIYAHNLNPEFRGQNDSCHTLSGIISGSQGITVLGGPLPWSWDWSVPASDGLRITNDSNNFSGMVTVTGGTLYFTPDREHAGVLLHGSLGDLRNEITLEGGYLARNDGRSMGECIASSRILHLGPGGGYIHSGPLIIRAKITGPGFLSQTIEGASQVTITNGANDYSGGTWVAMEKGGGFTVTENGKLGVGPVLVSPDTILTLHGNDNIDSNACLRISYCGLALFESVRPVIGSLSGSGVVYLGVKGTNKPGHDTCLTVGADGTDATFYGSIRQRGNRIDTGNGIGSLVKSGSGVLTLYGGHTYTGPTTIAQGSLDLRGGIAGDVIVPTEGTLAGTGSISGSLFVAGGTLAVDSGNPDGKMLLVAGSATLDGRIVLVSKFHPALAPGQSRDVLTAAAGITCHMTDTPVDFSLSLVNGSKTLRITKK